VDGWGYDIRRFRSDNGSGEYNNKNFRSILAVRGIAFEPCPPHTQHKNGIAERMIGVLTQKARAMMLDSQAPMQFWAEAINTACYLHRRTPNQSLDGKTPYEVLKRHRRLYRNGNSQRVSTALGDSQCVSTALDGNSQGVSTRPEQDDTMSAEDKPTLDHLRRFGCVVWKHIPKCQRMEAKMGARAKACMILGYVHDTTKIWRIWDPDFGKAINCSDVYFDESQTAYTSCMADNEHSVDPLGLPEEDPVITEVIEDPPENTIPLPAGMGSVEEASALDPRENTIPLPAGMGSVEEASALDPRENTIPLPAGMGSVEEASALDPQSVPDGAPNASPSQPRMLTRSQSRRAARAGTTLAAEVSTDDDPQSYREAHQEKK